MGSAASSMPSDESDRSIPVKIDSNAAAILEYQAAQRAALEAGGLRHYCSRPTNIYEMCLLGAFDDEKAKATCNKQFLPDVKACNFLLVTQATMLTCHKEMKAARSATLPDTNKYAKELERTFVPALKQQIGKKRLPEPIYEGGSNQQVKNAAAYARQEFAKGQHPDWDTVAPMFRSGYDKTTGEFQGRAP